MVGMMYRGFPHDGFDATPCTAPEGLMYRGAAYDGVSFRPAPLARDMSMVYRGVGYTLHGARAPTTRANRAPATLAPRRSAPIARRGDEVAV